MPVVQLGGAAGALTFDLAAGDTGVVFWASRSLDEWVTTGRSDVEPRDPRRFDYNDAIFLPGVRAFGSLAAGTRADGAVVLSGDDVRLGSATGARALAIAADVSAQLEALGAVFDAWIVAPTDGGLALKTALVALRVGGWPASVAATKVSGV